MNWRSSLVTATLVASSAWPMATGAAGSGPAGIFTINGSVGRPVTLSVSQLAALSLRNVNVSFAGTGTEQHSYRGPLVTDVVAVARPTVPAAGVHQLTLTFANAGGEQLTLAYGEIDGGSGNKQALLAFEEDGKSLAAGGPRLVMPNDGKGGRYLKGVTSVTVAALPAPASVEKPSGDGSVMIMGEGLTKKIYTFEQLQSFEPQTTVPVSFIGPNGPESYSEVGPLLSDLYKDAGLAPPQGASDSLGLVTVATADTERTAIGVGETDPDYGKVKAVLSVKEGPAGSEQDLTAPRLVVPGDQKSTRYVKNVFNLTIINPAADSTMAPGLADKGVRLVNANGIITSSGGASSRGDLTGKTLTAPIVAADTAAIPDSYWLVGRDGGVFNFGGAGYYGSTGNITLNKPIVDLSASPTAKGYWLTATDGGVFNYGDAGFFGSTGDIVINQPVVAMVPTPTGKGYLFVASDGGVFAFGDAKFSGSLGNVTLVQPIVDFALTPSGGGYLLLAADGGVFAFGDARYLGRDPSTKPNAVRLIPSVTGAGYRIVHSDATVTSIGSLAPLSKASVNGAVVTATS